MAFFIPEKVPFLDPETGRVHRDWMRLLREINDLLALVNAALAGLTFSSVGGTISLSQLVAHKATHQSGGTDAIKLDDLATPDDNTDLNASVSRHGLLPKLSGNGAQSLRGDGTWA